MMLCRLEFCMGIYQCRRQGARIRDKNMNLLGKKWLGNNSCDSGVKNDPCQKIRHADLLCRSSKILYFAYLAKAIPEPAYYRPWEFLYVEAQKLQSNRHKVVVRLSALRTGPLYLSGNIPGTHFCRGWVDLRVRVQLEGLCMKNSNDTIGSRTRDLPACSAVPHQLHRRVPQFAYL